MLDIQSYDLRFGLGMIAPAIAETYEALDDDRAKPAQDRVEQWYTCGLMADTTHDARNFDPSKCAIPFNFDLFRATGA